MVQGRVLAPYTDDQTYLTITHWFLVFRSRKLLLGNVWNNVSTTETVALSVLGDLLVFSVFLLRLLYICTSAVLWDLLVFSVFPGLEPWLLPLCS